MPQYQYRARDSGGKLIVGKLRAGNEDRAAALLKENGLTLISLEAEEKTSVFQKNIFGGVNMRDLILFFRQTASMINAGVPILDIIKAISKQSNKRLFQSVLNEVAYDIESGDSLSLAMGKHEKVFTPFMLGMIRTGEVSGRLSESLESLSTYLEQDYTFVRKVRAAFTYPAFVLVIVVVITIILFAFVVPQLVGLFSDAGVTLPLPTRILIAISNFLQQFWAVLLALIAVGGLLLRSYIKTPEGRFSVSTFVLRVPILSSLLSKLYLSRLTSVLHTLFSGDVPALEALVLAKEAVGNRIYQRVLDETVAAVKDGASISTVWRNEVYIPPMLISMVEVGERSGTVDKAFAEASRFFRRDVEATLETITVLLEPLLVIFLGVGVAIVVAAVLLPIYNLVLVI